MKKQYQHPICRMITATIQTNINAASGDNEWWIDTHKGKNEQNGGYWSGGWGSNAKYSFGENFEEEDQ